MPKKINYMTLFLLVSLSIVAIARGPRDHDLPSLRGATGWINTQPLSLEDLRGKVVLVEFWTYTCINWRRTLIEFLDPGVEVFDFTFG
jgi:hypothetical protein